MFPGGSKGNIRKKKVNKGLETTRLNGVGLQIKFHIFETSFCPKSGLVYGVPVSIPLKLHGSYMRSHGSSDLQIFFVFVEIIENFYRILRIKGYEGNF